jgi:hypothetical protein
MIVCRHEEGRYRLLSVVYILQKALAADAILKVYRKSTLLTVLAGLYLYILYSLIKVLYPSLFVYR